MSNLFDYEEAKNTRALVREIKEQEQDFEWYPTTKEIVDALINSLKNEHIDEVLDIGAGDGRVLEWIRESSNRKPDLYAIEKSDVLMRQIIRKRSITMVGVDFDETSLIEKRYNLIYSNPPYSKYEDWAYRILNEGNANFIALCIPQRWENSQKIKDVLLRQKITYEIVGEFDFNNAERQARAKVYLVLFKKKDTSDKRFEDFLKHNFNIDSDYIQRWDFDPYEEGREAKLNQVAKGDIIDALVDEYNRELNDYIEALKHLSEIPPYLFDDLAIKKYDIAKSVRHKLERLKQKYWRMIFDRLEPIKKRLTTGQASRMSYTMCSSNHIDFTKKNIFMIILWVIDNADELMQNGICNVFDQIAVEGNVFMYKSNERWKSDEWRYNKRKEELNGKKYKLDYRVVLTEYNLHYLAQDLEAVANMLGYEIKMYPFVFNNFNEDRYRWKDPFWNQNMRFLGKEIDVWGNRTLDYRNAEMILTYRAYKNGNIHVKFNQDFLASFNIAVARIRNWVKDKNEAKEIFSDVKDSVIDRAFELPLEMLSNFSHNDIAGLLE